MATATMSFARAFSTKRNKQHAVETSTPSFITRASSYRNGKPVVRTQISSPTALLSTSNVQVQTAKAIAGTKTIEIRKVAPAAAAAALEDSTSSDESDDGSSSTRSKDTATDASSVEDVPIEPKRLSYSKATMISVRRSSRPTLDLLEDENDDAPPQIPKRAPSHSKSAHIGIHRQRSLLRARATQPPPLDTATIWSESTIKALGPTTPLPTSPTPPQSGISVDTPSFDTSTILESPAESPFDDELAQLREIAREFGQSVRTVDEDIDVIHMEKHGLASFGAAEYMLEIQSLVHGMFGDEQPRHWLGTFF